MEIKRYDTYIILLLLILGIVIRLPITPHERGVDSFVTHSEANSISAKHQAKWSFYLWELFSKDSSSYPITIPLNLSIFSQYTGIDIEKTILIFCMLLGIIGTLSSYLMAREISKDRFFIFLVTFCFSLSPIFVSFTLWTVSTRNMLLALIPLFIWCFLKFENTNKRGYISLTFLLFILLIPVHHMFVLCYVIFGAYIMARIYFHLKTKIKIARLLPLYLPTILFILFISILLSLFFVANTFLETVTLNIITFILILILWCMIYLIHERYHYFKVKIRSISNYLPIFVPIILVLLFILLFLPQFFSGLKFFEGLKGVYHSGMFFTGTENYKIFLNMIIDYWSSEGILFPLALIGFVTMLKDVNNNKKYLFLILILLFCTPVVVYGEYMNIFLSPIFAVLIGLGLIVLMGKLRDIWNNRLTTPFFVGGLIISVLFSNFMMYHWVSLLYDPNAKDVDWMDEKTYHAALFLEEIIQKGSIFASSGIEGTRIRAFGDIPIISRSRGQWEIVRYHYADQHARDIISKYELRYVVENKNIYEKVIGSGHSLYNSPFLESIHKEKDKIYDNGLEGIWSLK